MYCVKCGVELEKSERKCPLCLTPVYFPELDKLTEDPPYPKFSGNRDEINPRGICFIASVMFALAAVISLFCDFNLNGGITWSGYVLGGLVLAYTVAILPAWFKRAHPAVFAPVDFGAAGLLVLYIDLSTGGGWFVPFALPIIGAAALTVCSVIILCHYIRKGYLYILGGASIALGACAVMIEFLIHKNFLIHHTDLRWSVYPLISFVMIGLMLIVIALVKPFRESLRKIFAT